MMKTLQLKKVLMGGQRTRKSEAVREKVVKGSIHYVISCMQFLRISSFFPSELLLHLREKHAPNRRMYDCTFSQSPIQLYSIYFSQCFTIKAT